MPGCVCTLAHSGLRAPVIAAPMKTLSTNHVQSTSVAPAIDGSSQDSSQDKHSCKALSVLRRCNSRGHVGRVAVDHDMHTVSADICTVEHEIGWCSELIRDGDVDNLLDLVDFMDSVNQIPQPPIPPPPPPPSLPDDEDLQFRLDLSDDSRRWQRILEHRLRHEAQIQRTARLQVQ